jgi:hypothetical protein
MRILGFDKTHLKTITCKHCAAILEYGPGDVREGFTENYRGIPESTFSYIVCENCKKWIKWNIESLIDDWWE